MRKTRLFWQLYSAFLLVIALSVVAVAWYSSRQIRSFFLNQTGDNLKIRAYLFQNNISGLDVLKNSEYINFLCKKLGRVSRTRFTVVLPGGLVLGDSERPSRLMENHADRPEIIQALKGEIGRQIRRSATLNQKMMYVAVPVRLDGRIAAVIRTSVAISSIDQTLHEIYSRIVIWGLIILLAVAMLSLLLPRRLSRPLEELKKGAERFARGELNLKIHVSASEEINTLAEMMNTMAAQLDERINMIARENNEKEAILSGMTEAVVAIDQDEKIIHLNQTAARFLDTKPKKAEGRFIHEVIRNPNLQQFVRRTLEAEKPVEGDVVIPGKEDRFLRAYGTILRNADNNRIGALIVLNDMTNIYRLENIRREFVANVSHELKTPITSIKGFVETLREGAMNNPAEAERFLAIIARHVDRLEAIIEDLLSLSRIEQEAERRRITLNMTNIKEVLQSARLACETKALSKEIALDLSCPDDLTASLNAQLIEQAVVNLIDNALAYSEPGSDVHIQAEQRDKELIISVIDHGCGISEEHLPRLFERFYRVDKSHSKTKGGTGLGLAIVKHIVQSHGGYVTVESRPGQGSRFDLHLPENQSPDS